MLGISNLQREGIRDTPVDQRSIKKTVAATTLERAVADPTPSENTIEQTDSRLNLNDSDIRLNSSAETTAARAEKILELDEEERPAALADELRELDDDGQAELIGEILVQDERAFERNNWLNPATLDEFNDPFVRNKSDELPVSDEDAKVLAEGIAIAWNRDALPTVDYFEGIDESSLDGFADGATARRFADFFNNSRSSEVMEFRASYASHVYENYVAYDPSEANEHRIEDYAFDAELLVTRLVADKYVPSSVAFEFYENSFQGSSAPQDFATFLNRASESAYDRQILEDRGFDPVLAFAKLAQDPGPYSYDFDNAANREGIAVGLAVALGAEDSKIRRTENKENQVERLEAITEAFDDHHVAVLDELASKQRGTLDEDGKIDQSHPSLTNFFRYTVGNTDLDNRTTARDAALDYFDRQVEYASVAGEFDGTAEARAINVAAAASLATQDIITDAREQREANIRAATFVLDAALSVTPVGAGRAAVVSALGASFGGSVTSALVTKIADELLEAGQNRITSATRDLVLEELLEDSDIDSDIGANQEFLDISINRLEAILLIEDTLDRSSNEVDEDGRPIGGVLDADVEEAYRRIADGAVTKANLG